MERKDWVRVEMTKVEPIETYAAFQAAMNDWTPDASVYTPRADAEAMSEIRHALAVRYPAFAERYMGGAAFQCRITPAVYEDFNTRLVRSVEEYPRPSAPATTNLQRMDRALGFVESAGAVLKQAGNAICHIDDEEADRLVTAAARAVAEAERHLRQESNKRFRSVENYLRGREIAEMKAGATAHDESLG